jgi:large-conductance mechanosensitive channel
MSTRGEFFNWFFENRQLDNLIIAGLFTTAISTFLTSFEESIIQPILKAVLAKNKNATTMEIGKYKIMFKLHTLVSAFLKLMIQLIIAYFVFRYIIYLKKRYLKNKT